MALPSSGMIDMNSIRTAFGITGTITLQDIYDGKLFYGPSVPFIPSTGEISLSNFYGKSNVPQPLTAAASSNCRQAYGLRRMTSNYTGPLITIRRSGDSSNVDVYGDVNGILGLSANGRGIALSNFLGSNTGYVTKWYSQVGTGHYIHTVLAEQPELQWVNNEYKIYFSGSTNLYQETAFQYNNEFSFLVKTKPGRTINTQSESNGGYADTSPQNKLLWAVYGGNTGGMGVEIGTNGIGVIQHGGAYYPRVLTHSNDTRYANSSNVDVMVTFSNLVPKYYLNRSFVKNGQTSSRTVFFQPLRIGRGMYGTYQGHVQEFLIWNKELNADQVMALQN